jgi:hypothetical protein
VIDAWTGKQDAARGLLLELIKDILAIVFVLRE